MHFVRPAFYFSKVGSSRWVVHRMNAKGIIAADANPVAEIERLGAPGPFVVLRVGSHADVKGILIRAARGVRYSTRRAIEDAFADFVTEGSWRVASSS